jgi:hypothetical protein
MIHWQLQHPESRGRAGISEARMNDKFGWIKEYGDDIEAWAECQEVVSLGVKFANQQGLYRGAAEEFKRLVVPHGRHAQTRELIKRSIAFLEEQEVGLKRNERLPLSTEIVESSFAKYKQLERQHSKGGFTTLLPACNRSRGGGERPQSRGGEGEIAGRECRHEEKRRKRHTPYERRLGKVADFPVCSARPRRKTRRKRHTPYERRLGKVADFPVCSARQSSPVAPRAFPRLRPQSVYFLWSGVLFGLQAYP